MWKSWSRSWIDLPNYTRKNDFCTVRGTDMKEFEIRITSLQDVVTFVNLATQRPFDVLVGNDFHKVNGKSFMEMFCLNFSRPLKASMICTEEEYQQFLLDAESLLVK